MRLSFYILSICLLIVACGPTQLANKAIKKLTEEEFVKAEELINKALEKDSLLPANLYAKSRLLIDFKDPKFYDSAYWFANKAITQYDSLDEKTEQAHEKKGFDMDTLYSQKLLIDSLAFNWVTRKNTEEDFNYFLQNYPTARQTALAKTKRNALAFAKAKSRNTYQSYNAFIEKYPDAVQVSEARDRYEKLYFDKSTADGKVLSYIRFLEKNPDTPYRRDAEKNIFDVVTSEHSVGGYEIFIKNYPKSYLRKKALNYAYHVAKSSDVQQLNVSLTDSLKTAKRLEPFGLIPFIESEKFGFMDTDGNTIIEALYDSIADEYKCQITSKDFLVVDERVVGRNSFTVTDKEVNEIEDLGYGLLKVKVGNLFGIVHKSGEEVTEINYDDVKLFNGNILALKKGREWYLKTISGKLIVADSFDDIFQLGSTIALEINDKVALKTPGQLLSAVDGNPLSFDYSILDYELLEEGKIWIEDESGEWILGSNLQKITPKGVLEIEILDDNYILKAESKETLVDGNFNELMRSNSSLKHSRNWIYTHQDTTAFAMSIHKGVNETLKADSFNIYGDFFLVSFLNDSLTVNTPNKRVLKSKASDYALKILRNTYTEYLLISYGEELISIDTAGNKMKPEAIEGLEPLGREFFTYEYKRKKGLISALTGLRILKPEYEAIGNYKNGNVSLLNDKKFGLYNNRYKLTIKAKYDKNIQVYNDSTFIVSDDGKSFFYTKDGDQLPEEGFDKIIHFSDSIAITEKAGSFSFYNLNSRAAEKHTFQTYKLITLESGENLVMIRSDKKYGIVSSLKGELIPPAYNDLIILENGNQPIFFAEKNITEAEFYVVIYYNYLGEIIQKQAYEPEDYFRLYCDQ